MTIVMKKIITLLIVGVIIIGGALIYFKNSGLKIQNQTSSQAQIKNDFLDEKREIIIKASRFEYNPSVITIKKGEKIKLIIDNMDAAHGIRIPELGISGKDFVEFTAEKAGEFTWYCNYFCGQGHQRMQGKLIVE